MPVTNKPLTPEAVQQTLAAAGIDTASGLALLNGKAERYFAMLERFLDHHADSATAITSALADNEPAAVQRLAHTLKGAAAIIGLHSISTTAMAVEQALLDGAPHAILTARVHTLQHEHRRIVGVLRDTLPKA